jgi:hypothetical protein
MKGFGEDVLINTIIMGYPLFDLSILQRSSFYSVRVEEAAKANKSSNPMSNTTGKDVPVSTAAIRSGAIRKTMKIFRTGCK